MGNTVRLRKAEETDDGGQLVLDVCEGQKRFAGSESREGGNKGGGQGPGGGGGSTQGLGGEAGGGEQGLGSGGGGGAQSLGSGAEGGSLGMASIPGCGRTDAVQGPAAGAGGLLQQSSRATMQLEALGQRSGEGLQLPAEPSEFGDATASPKRKQEAAPSSKEKKPRQAAEIEANAGAAIAAKLENGVTSDNLPDRLEKLKAVEMAAYLKYRGEKPGQLVKGNLEARIRQYLATKGPLAQPPG